MCVVTVVNLWHEVTTAKVDVLFLHLKDKRAVIIYAPCTKIKLELALTRGIKYFNRINAGKV